MMNILVENIDVDSLLLTKGNLSKPFKKMIKDGLITKDEALQIQSQLIDEYENKQVLQEGIIRRLFFLTTHTHLDLTSLHKISYFLNEEDVCGYCGFDITENEKTCPICGYNLEYVNKNQEDEVTEDEVKELLTNLLVGMGKTDKKTADILLNPEDNIIYYQDKDKLINYNNPEDTFELYEDAIYMLDEDRKSYDKYEICFYKCLEGIPYSNSLEESIEFYTELCDYPDEERIYHDILESNYVSEYIIPEYWDETADSIKKTDLQDILRKHGLKVSGNKKELSDRIKENVELEKIRYNDIESLKDTEYTIYLITPKGYKYLEDNKYIDIADSILYEYHYDEYKEYITENEKVDLITNTINFLELHVQKEIKNKKQFCYTSHLRTQSQIYNLYCHEKYFKSLIRVFIANLNPLDADDPFSYPDELIDEYILKKIQKEYDGDKNNLEELIKEEYEKINDITIPLDELLNNLDRLLENNKISKLDEKWQKEYLKNNNSFLF